MPVSIQEGGRTFGSDFARWFDGRSGAIWRLADRDASVAAAVLSGLWEVGEAVRGLRSLGRILSPSPTLPDTPTHGPVASLALGTLDVVAQVLATNAEDES